MMKRLAIAGLALLLSLPAAAVASGRAAAPPGQAQAGARPDNESLRFTKHARARMKERGVSPEAVKAAVARGERFRYFHQSKWKTGYYDAERRLLIAADGDVVITVIADAGRRYVESLKRNHP